MKTHRGLRPAVLPLACLTAGVLALSACGGGGSAGTSTSAAAPSSAAPAATTAAAPSPAASSEAASPAAAQPSVGADGTVGFETAAAGSGTGLKLGLIALDDSIPFSKLVSDSIKAQAKAAGAELVFCDSKLDSAKALDCAKNFATQGVQGYLNFQPVAKAAQAICDAGPKGAPVIAIDIAQGNCQTAFMGANNSRAGFVAGEGLGKYVKAKFDCKYDAYISLEDLGAGEVNKLRMNGIRDGFKSVCPGDLTGERVLDAGRQDKALSKFADVLTALPQAKTILVVGINDDSVLGALAAARTAGRDKQLYMAGMGADPTSHCQIANNANWAGDAAFFPERYGEIGIPWLIRAVKGEKVPAKLLVDHKFVNKDNLAENYKVSGC